MTEHRISPLQWLSTKFASLNHTHNEYITSHQDITGKEDKSNKSSSISNDTGSTSKYPTVKAVEDYSQPKGNYLTSHQSLTGYLKTTDVKDNLTSTDTDKPLSANQGKELKGLVDGKSDEGHTHSQYLTQHQSLKTINNETLVGTGNITINTGSSFSGSYADLTNKPSYTATVTSSTSGAYKIGSINISGSSVDIYGKDTDTAPPTASTTTPSADATAGSYGSGTTYARSNHVHPKSSIYAEAGHNHTGTYANASHNHSYNDISNVSVVEVTVTYTDDSTETIKLLKYTGT